MYCVNCGKEIAKEAKFCGTCGHKNSEVSPNSPKKDFKSRLSRLGEIIVVLNNVDGELEESQIPNLEIEVRSLIEEGVVPSSQMYKLLEAQALIQFQYGNDEEALKYIRESVKNHGSMYREARALIEQINARLTLDVDDEVQNDNEPTSQLDGIEGWLAFAVISLGIGVLYNLYHGLTGWGDVTNIPYEIKAALPNYQGLVLLEQVIQLLAATAGITIIVLVLKRKAIARLISIVFLASITLWYGIDYILATNMFADYPDSLEAIKSTTALIQKMVVVNILWLLYFIFSKRVKNTLTIN